jgi:hypothetical protein
MALPKGLEFLQAGWWLIHLVGVALVFAWAYRKGRGDERRAQRARELERRAASSTSTGANS